MTNRYNITVTFKDKAQMLIDIEADDNPREILETELDSKKNWGIRIGDYFIAKEEILWIKIEGEKLIEKHSRE